MSDSFNPDDIITRAGFSNPRLRELSDDEEAFADGPFGSNLKTEHYTKSGARVVRLQNIGLGVFLDHAKAFVSLEHFHKLRRHEVRPGDIVVAALGDGARPAGRACLIPDGFGLGIVKADCFRVRLPSTVIDRRFLLQFFNSPGSLNRVAADMRGATRPRVTLEMLKQTRIELPSLVEQQNIAERLQNLLAVSRELLASLGSQSKYLDTLGLALIRETVNGEGTTQLPIRKCLDEVTEGIGERWRDFPVLGARRSGLARAKEGVGKAPGRYKPAQIGTVFYNPMRILLGSIAIVDEDDAPGITSPDYVAMTALEGVLHPLWFYHWFRSPDGAEFIKSLTRGAVRERLLFNRLANSTIPVPPYHVQVACVAKLREIKRARQHIEKRLVDVEKLPAAILRATFGGAA